MTISFFCAKKAERTKQPPMLEQKKDTPFGVSFKYRIGKIPSVKKRNPRALEPLLFDRRKRFLSPLCEAVQRQPQSTVAFIY